jgi:hypothetical protein
MRRPVTEGGLKAEWDAWEMLQEFDRLSKTVGRVTALAMVIQADRNRRG